MALTKEQKKNIKDKLKKAIKDQKAMVFVNFSGLRAQDLEKLREKLKEVGAKMMVSKKTLADLAFKEEKIDFDKKELENELAIIFAFEDEITPAKTIYEFSKEKENLKIVGGYVENEKIDKEKMIVLAQLPSKQELYARLAGTLFAPINNFVNLQAQTIKGLFYVLLAIK